MPYKSEAQRKYFNANRAKLESQGVDVDEWNESSKGKKLPEKAKKKNEKEAIDSSISSTLQELLSNTLDLALLVKHCHWNVRGTMFDPVHKFLDKVHGTLTEISDDLAERMVALDYPASANTSDIASDSDMESFPVKFLDPETIITKLITDLSKLTDMFNAAIGKTESNPVTSNLLQDMTYKLEKRLWMLRSQKPNSAEKSAKEINMDIKELAKFAAGRCWKGYEPVPGKKPYSEDSCRPAGSKKKTEKKSSIQELAIKAAGWKSETLLPALNPLNIVGSPIGALLAALKPTRDTKDQAKADQEVWKNLLIPGRGSYNQWKRIGYGMRHPELLDEGRRLRRERKEGKPKPGTAEYQADLQKALKERGMTMSDYYA